MKKQRCSTSQVTQPWHELIRDVVFYVTLVALSDVIMGRICLTVKRPVTQLFVHTGTFPRTVDDGVSDFEFTMHASSAGSYTCRCENRFNISGTSSGSAVQFRETGALVGFLRWSLHVGEISTLNKVLKKHPQSRIDLKVIFAVGRLVSQEATLPCTSVFIAVVSRPNLEDSFFNKT